MARNRERDRNRPERIEQEDDSHMQRTNIEREDRDMSAGSQGDGMAGSEGIEDPATEETDGNGRTFSGQGRQKEGSSSREGTGYTGESVTDESES